MINEKEFNEIIKCIEFSKQNGLYIVDKEKAKNKLKEKGLMKKSALEEAEEFRKRHYPDDYNLETSSDIMAVELYKLCMKAVRQLQEEIDDKEKRI